MESVGRSIGCTTSLPSGERWEIGGRDSVINLTGTWRRVLGAARM